MNKRFDQPEILDWVTFGRPQSQESVRDQISQLISVATKLGLYDAADYLKISVDGRESTQSRSSLIGR